MKPADAGAAPAIETRTATAVASSSAAPRRTLIRGRGYRRRAVEKHINSVFSKLGLSEEPDVHRRVKAVLLYLADR